MFPQNVAVPVLFNACMAVPVMAEEAVEVEARFASWNRTPPLVPQKYPKLQMHLLSEKWR